MSINLKRLKPHHRGMARAQVAFGLRVSELAAKFGMSPQQVTNITNSPLYNAEIARIESIADEHAGRLDEELKSLAERAVEIVAEDLMQNEKSEHRTKVAFGILDRTGYGKNEKLQDNRKQKIIINNYAPNPGDDPKEAMRKLKLVRDVFKEEGETGGDL